VSGPVRRRIIEILSAHPEGLMRSHLFDLVYADDPNGGPNDMRVIPVLIKHANRELAPQGWQIKTTLGRGALYKLVKIDGSTKLKPARNPDAREVAGTQSAISAREHR
jgi:hypothetical protein